MKVDDYRFGHIEIGGRSYDTDLIITPERVVDGWWRRSGHKLEVADLEAVLDACPDTLIIGCGYYGRMQVPQATRAFLEQRGIRIEVGTTSEAVSRFNQLQQAAARVVAALHLTC